MSTDPVAAERVDLHLHSVHSDGLLEPAAVVDLAANAEVQLLSLTDHDTTAGLEQAHARCRERNVDFVAGTELSCTWRGQTLHVLGYGFDPADRPLQQRLEALKETRRERLRHIGRRLVKQGLPASDWIGEIEASNEVVTRTHLARALVAARQAETVADAFKRFLGRGRPGHVASAYPPLDATVSAIGAAGGVAVLAHPLRYTLSAGARRQLLTDFRTAGGRGIEVVCGGARNQMDALAALALRFDLDGSVGSDFHDPAIPWNPPGRLAKLPHPVRPVWRGFPVAAPSSR
jgi:predicted metal-dependent phosphoesterase TrpH